MLTVWTRSKPYVVNELFEVRKKYIYIPEIHRNSAKFGDETCCKHIKKKVMNCSKAWSCWVTCNTCARDGKQTKRLLLNRLQYWKQNKAISDIKMADYRSSETSTETRSWKMVHDKHAKESVKICKSCERANELQWRIPSPIV